MRHPFPGLFAFPLLLMFIAATSTRADDDISPDTRKQIAALEAQVKALQAQVALLKKELEDAKATIKFLTESTKRAGEEPTREPTKEPPHAREPATKSDRPTIAAPVELLRNMPAELRPKPTVGWDKFLYPKVEEWVAAQKVDAVFDARCELVAASARRLNEAAQRHWKTNKEWQVTFAFEPREAAFGTVTLTQSIAESGFANSIRLFCDETVARKAEKLKKGSLVRVRGHVFRMELDYSPAISTRATLTASLRDATLPELEP